MSDDAMWCIVMFDFPVKTSEQRRYATSFREKILDLGFVRIQYSVYARYNPSPSGDYSRIKNLLKYLPEYGYVRVLYISDRQWAKSLKFFNAMPEDPDYPPEQLSFF
ncbi:CRISPR-associated endonuclease Cas2 [Actinomycetaceae bacterium TAE3-ERU4]|nr:CRISPR-associated endonuclease Cas2 [Actinomycetaceae bacterium TAE3-ERU4]